MCAVKFDVPLIKGKKQRTAVFYITLQRLGKDDVEPVCRIPLVTSQKEEQSLISTTVKVKIISC